MGKKDRTIVETVVLNDIKNVKKKEKLMTVKVDPKLAKTRAKSKKIGLSLSRKSSRGSNSSDDSSDDSSEDSSDDDKKKRKPKKTLLVDAKKALPSAESKLVEEVLSYFQEIPECQDYSAEELYQIYLEKNDPNFNSKNVNPFSRSNNTYGSRSSSGGLGSPIPPITPISPISPISPVSPISNPSISPFALPLPIDSRKHGSRNNSKTLPFNKFEKLLITHNIIYSKKCFYYSNQIRVAKQYQEPDLSKENQANPENKLYSDPFQIVVDPNFNSRDSNTNTNRKQKPLKIVATRDIKKNDLVFYDVPDPILFVPPLDKLTVMRLGYACSTCGNSTVNQSTHYTMVHGLDCSECDNIWCSPQCFKMGYAFHKQVTHPAMKHLPMAAVAFNKDKVQQRYNSPTHFSIDGKAWIEFEDFCIVHCWVGGYVIGCLIARFKTFDILYQKFPVIDQRTRVRAMDSVGPNGAFDKKELLPENGTEVELNMIYESGFRHMYKCFPGINMQFAQYMELVGTFNINNYDGQLYPLYSFLNHDCEPNTRIVKIDNNEDHLYEDFDDSDIEEEILKTEILKNNPNISDLGFTDSSYLYTDIDTDTDFEQLLEKSTRGDRSENSSLLDIIEEDESIDKGRLTNKLVNVDGVPYDNSSESNSDQSYTTEKEESLTPDWIDEKYEVHKHYKFGVYTEGFITDSSEEEEESSSESSSSSSDSSGDSSSDSSLSEPVEGLAITTDNFIAFLANEDEDGYTSQGPSIPEKLKLKKKKKSHAKKVDDDKAHTNEEMEKILRKKKRRKHKHRKHRSSSSRRHHRHRTHSHKNLDPSEQPATKNNSVSITNDYATTEAPPSLDQEMEHHQLRHASPPQMKSISDFRSSSDEGFQRDDRFGPVPPSGPHQLQQQHSFNDFRELPSMQQNGFNEMNNAGDFRGNQQMMYPNGNFNDGQSPNGFGSPNPNGYGINSRPDIQTVGDFQGQGQGQYYQQNGYVDPQQQQYMGQGQYPYPEQNDNNGYVQNGNFQENNSQVPLRQVNSYDSAERQMHEEVQKSSKKKNGSKVRTLGRSKSIGPEITKRNQKINPASDEEYAEEEYSDFETEPYNSAGKSMVQLAEENAKREKLRKEKHKDYINNERTTDRNTALNCKPSTNVKNKNVRNNSLNKTKPEFGLKVYARKNIKAGDELTVSLVNPLHNVHLRKRELRVNYGFDCECTRCVKELVYRKSKHAEKNKKGSSLLVRKITTNEQKQPETKNKHGKKKPVIRTDIPDVHKVLRTGKKIDLEFSDEFEAYRIKNAAIRFDNKVVVYSERY
ncbi:S-adenosylmethionine-dependent methyltransferase SCDLUD_004399 [Saccharomycodes ludwigii]|uniref:S-adenosylmethionine-dependent methyltransferase n=1 Tax=Saccharomycodes ludwigii TaxID=36035 RepID=UPI001E8ABB11|nr:hypothetical protein SCDLUD_004399 [Saccharomycodes ludwigii]KAH3900079.1 hypothetical protein SCDLUD_004399 [Saccharomycodes ludwigii]